MNLDKHISLTQALAWIVASMFVVSGGSYALLQQLRYKQSHVHYAPVLSSLIQTGPQKQALSTEYLLELLDLSVDHPYPVKQLKVEEMEKRLLRSPLISHAKVSLLKPGTLYVDYTVRQPVAWLEDYGNVALDREGHLFPFAPFFSPKNLPALYLGLAPFGEASSDLQKPTATWDNPLSGKLFALALEVLNIVSDPKVSDQFAIRRIDVSNALSPSYGMREIVVITEDVFTQHVQGKDVEFHQPRLLRLSVKHFAKELGNYLSLRRPLLEEEQKTVAQATFPSSVAHLPEKVLDFRIEHLAFVQDQGASDSLLGKKQ